MGSWSVNFMCMTDTGVSFLGNVIVGSASGPDDAQTKAQSQLAERGTTIMLMMGAPPIPVNVAAAMLVSCIPLKSTISIATSMPGATKH